LRQEYRNLGEIEGLDREWHEEGQRSADHGSQRNNRTIQEENEELDNSFGRKQNHQAPNSRQDYPKMQPFNEHPEPQMSV